MMKNKPRIIPMTEETMQKSDDLIKLLKGKDGMEKEDAVGIVYESAYYGNLDAVIEFAQNNPSADLTDFHNFLDKLDDNFVEN